METIYRDPGEPPVLDWIDVSLIDIDPAYQRGLDEARVQRILGWFTWDAFGAIVIAPADEGRYHCTDGQHRLAAARRHPAVSVVPAIIISAQVRRPRPRTSSRSTGSARISRRWIDIGQRSQLAMMMPRRSNRCASAPASRSCATPARSMSRARPWPSARSAHSSTNGARCARVRSSKSWPRPI